MLVCTPLRDNKSNITKSKMGYNKGNNSKQKKQFVTSANKLKSILLSTRSIPQIVTCPVILYLKDDKDLKGG